MTSCSYLTLSSIYLQSGSSGEGEVAIEEKPNATTGGLQSHQHSDKSYVWLNDAAQVLVTSIQDIGLTKSLH